MIHPSGDHCPTCGKPHAPIRPMRTQTESFVHCKCGAELKVGESGKLPVCPCGREEK